MRTGPWFKYIIITNCIYTRHQGKKTPQDVSICLKTLQNITKEEWLKMCDVTGEKLGYDISDNLVIKDAVKTSVPSKDELRKLREKYYTPN